MLPVSPQEMGHTDLKNWFCRLMLETIPPQKNVAVPVPRSTVSEGPTTATGCVTSQAAKANVEIAGILINFIIFSIYFVS
jgi:hypothetical protein